MNRGTKLTAAVVLGILAYAAWPALQTLKLGELKRQTADETQR